MVNLFLVYRIMFLLPKGIQFFEYTIFSLLSFFFYLSSFILFVFLPFSFSHFLYIIFFCVYFVATNTPNTCTALLLTVGCSL